MNTARRPGYDAFGSFFSQSVDELVHLPESEYTVPDLPPAVADSSSSSSSAAPLSTADFGQSRCKSEHFLLAPEWVFVNHGAFGGTLRSVLARAQAWQRFQEEQPLRYFDRVLLPQLAHQIRLLAAFVQAAPGEIALIQNATAGLNAVIQSEVRRLQPGDGVLQLDIAYGAVKKMLATECAAAGATLHTAAVRLPVREPAELVAVLVAALDKAAAGPAPVRFCVLDHVASNTAIRLPIEAMARECRQRGVRLLVDGAHGLLAQPLDMAALAAAGVSYYISNCHKWLCSHKGAAMLWAPKALQPGLHPAIVSHGSAAGFVSAFLWDGCRDYSAALTVGDALAVWQAAGVDAVRAHITETVAAAAEMLAAAWETELPLGRALLSSMALVELPAALQPQPGPATSDHASALQNALFDARFEVPVKALQGKLYLRISAHVYNTPTDYSRLRDHILQLARSMPSPQAQQIDSK